FRHDHSQVTGFRIRFGHRDASRDPATFHYLGTRLYRCDPRPEGGHSRTSRSAVGRTASPCSASVRASGRTPPLEPRNSYVCTTIEMKAGGGILSIQAAFRLAT